MLSLPPKSSRASVVGANHTACRFEASKPSTAGSMLVTGFPYDVHERVDELGDLVARPRHVCHRQPDHRLLLVRERLDRGLERVNLVDERAQPFQFALVLGSDDFCEESAQHGESVRGYSDDSNTVKVAY
mgnify:CR=1 FL=1